MNRCNLRLVLLEISQVSTCKNEAQRFIFHHVCRWSETKRRCKDTNKRAKNQRKKLFFFVLSSESIFDEVRDTKKRAKNQRKMFFSLFFRVKVSSTKSEIRINEQRTKENPNFYYSEAEQLLSCQSQNQILSLPVLGQNGMHFGPKQVAFWPKTECVLAQNGRQWPIVFRPYR